MRGERPIAAMVTLSSGATAWCWKVAYDESYARFSPGVQILLDVTQTLLDDPAVARADSCATADHPMIDHVWRERLALADRLVSVGRGTSFAFALVRALEQMRRAAIGGAKALRDCVEGGEIVSQLRAVASRLLPQQPPDHLAGGRHRHLLDEGDLARIFVRRKPRPHEALDLGGERIGRRMAGFQHDERLDDLGAHRIGLADHRGERDRRMPDQAILDLGRADAIAGRGDDVVVAADEVT